MTGDEYLLEMNNISKEFPGVKALENVSFSLKKGEVHALVGENGAGKSTLMKILSGFHPKDSGEIYINDKIVEILNPINAIELGISTIYQEIIAVHHITVAENILLGNRPKNKFGLINWREMEHKVKSILDELSIELPTSKLVSNLSIAQQQLVEIAKALSMEAKIVIMDEPTSPLTEEETKTLFNIIKRIKSKGVSVIYISHRIEEIFKIADRVTVLRDGKKICEKIVRETNSDEIIKYMIGRELNEMYGKESSMAKEKIVLRVENFSKKREFKDINFKLYEGEILGFAGLVGAGRSELMKSLYGINIKDSGEIYLNGNKVNINSPLDAIRLGIGMVPEEKKTEGLMLDLAVDQNITASSLKEISKYGFLSRGLEVSLANKFVKKLSINCPSLSQKVMYLSGGNQQKVIISRWLALNSKILILDEPTKGIDVGSKAEIHKLIANIAKQGTSVILISSEITEILKMSNRIIVMKEGKIVTILNAAEANEESILRSMVEVKMDYVIKL